MSQFINPSANIPKAILLPLGILIAIGIGWLTSLMGIAAPAILVVLAFAIPFVVAVFYEPKYGLMAFIVFCFTVQIFLREVGGSIPYGILGEALLLLTWIAVLSNSSNKKFEWSNLRSDLMYLTLFWFFINIVEVFNPADVSVRGWLQEIRGTSLIWFLVVPLALLVFNKNKDLNIFLYLIIGISILAAINGVKQLYIGPWPGEQAFLNGPSQKTHILFGKLRVFSFYSDAGNFGASQAHIGLIALILALGPFKLWKRILLFLAAGLLFYGMLISGTRGALYALVVGLAVAIFLSKNFKMMILGTAIAFSGLFLLKFTSIGSGSYHVQRLRSALNPEDASLGVRLYNQERLAEYLDTRPFGGGMGVIGFWGVKYNSDRYLASIPPDSYWVKVWAMYGIVGFILWFGIMMYILGKCCGIVWNTRDKRLRIKLMALTAGAAGILFCSYGNEVINAMPSSMIVYISWAFIFLGPKLDNKLDSKKREAALAESYA
ncbi:O-antigen ligase domain-containing protein [Pontibacter diazotrophicus]|uniref:O-antigen ligase domain-containing protein n=1 Tax=Pontibacter diazotrophicus TaxID=1400979 RepID=A0A3D8LHG1_9BACT|nr:O-antigen ligase family protein [Pontibacter diazotrophicus]RDV16684.1 O-antigen ligase domain-containing protein [Pontibacter diazotrophicus]